MNDDYLISRLRSADPADTEPTSADVAAAAALGRRLRRRRHALAGAGTASALTLAAVVALAVVPGGESAVLQQALPATDPGTNPAGAKPYVDPYELLHEALGPTHWTSGRTTGGDRALALDPGSPAADGLPAGYPARARIGVYTTSPQTIPTCSSHADPRYSSCEVRGHGEGDLRIDRRFFISDERAGSAVTFVAYFRPDGVQVTAWIDVDAPRGSTSGDGWRRAEAWLTEFEDELITAATDPRADVDPAVRAEENARTAYLDAVDANAALLRDVLGADWDLTTFPWGGLRTADRTSLRPKSPTRDALPAGWHVRAELTGTTKALSGEQPCGPTSQRTVSFKTCAARTLPDGRAVLIGGAHGATDDGRAAAEGLRVTYSRPDGTVVFAELVVVHESADVTAESRQRARTWLDAFEDELVTAATADEVQLVPDGPWAD